MQPNRNPDGPRIYAPSLRAIREALGLTPGELAAAAGVSVSYLRKIESGARTDISDRVAADLADALGVGLDAITRPVVLVSPDWPE